MKVQMTIFWAFPLGSSNVSEEIASPIFRVKEFASGKCFNIDNTPYRNPEDHPLGKDHHECLLCEGCTVHLKFTL
jgi:hypothetical protein